MCVCVFVCLCRHGRVSNVLRLVNSSMSLSSSLSSSMSVDVCCCEVVTCSHLTLTQHSPSGAVASDFWRSVSLQSRHTLPSVADIMSCVGHLCHHTSVLSHVTSLVSMVRVGLNVIDQCHTCSFVAQLMACGPAYHLNM